MLGTKENSRVLELLPISNVWKISNVVQKLNPKLRANKRYL